jgi:prefoldin alpha subunit
MLYNYENRDVSGHEFFPVREHIPPYHDVFMIPEDIHIRSQDYFIQYVNEGWQILADTMQPMDQRELMTLQHYLKEYGQQAEIFVSQLEMLENARMEAHAAIEALEGMMATEDGVVLLQIGAGASVRAKILEPEKVMLAIGSDVVVERKNKDAIEFLKERIMEMEASQKKVAETLDRLRSQMNEINKRLEAGYQQSMAAGQD